MQLPLALRALHTPAAPEPTQGVVYTRPEAAGPMLDLAGYTPDRPLHRMRLLEPSCGEGVFLLAALDRLLEAFHRDGGSWADVQRLAPALRGVEIRHDACRIAADSLARRLISRGCPDRDAALLARRWIVQGDFLSPEDPGTSPTGSQDTDPQDRYDVVIGNPPYVRQEEIAPERLRRYRALYLTMQERADLYVPFYERGLSLLAPEGRLVFLCTDRWLKNRYGAGLRRWLQREWSLDRVIQVEAGQVFEEAVLSYPAITCLRRGAARETRFEVCGDVRRLVRDPAPEPGAGVKPGRPLAGDGRPVLSATGRPRRILEELERRLPTVEEAGCAVGIGVATGADRIFVGRMADLPVEPDRLLPLAMTADLRGGRLSWGGNAIVNPFLPDGRLAPLEAFPRLRRYLEDHREALSARYCARKRPDQWYRTIDRISPGLLRSPKLLIGDIQARPNFVHDEGRYYPHHNLYYVTSTSWPMDDLLKILTSSISSFFVCLYSTRVKGDYVRFQAQYLRRIRLPAWTPDTRAALQSLPLSAALARIYAIDPSDLQTIQGFVDASLPPA